jgi:hypothetical protein
LFRRPKLNLSSSAVGKKEGSLFVPPDASSAFTHAVTELQNTFGHNQTSVLDIA